MGSRPGAGTVGSSYSTGIGGSSSYSSGRVRDFDYFLAASAAKNCENKPLKKAVIQSAASAASAKGSCASSRLDHGLKFYASRGGCASSRLINEFSDC